MKQNKQILYNNRILNCLLSGETCTIQQVAENVGLSEKTVRTRINQINDWLHIENLGHIEKKQGTGIWLQTDPVQKRNLQNQLSTDCTGTSVKMQDTSDKQLIGKLLKLKNGEVVTMQQIADWLYLSPPTVAFLLKMVQPWFAERKLEIVSMRSKGISLKGNEWHIRLAIKDYMLEMMPEVMEALLGTFAPGVDVARIRHIVVDAESAWRIELADRSFNMVWIMVCLSLARKSAETEDNLSVTEENIQNYNEYAFAESIYQRIERCYQTKISENDIRMLGMLLMMVRKLKNFSESQDNYAVQYDRELRDFVKLVIDTIDSVLDIDLSDDKLLYDSLVFHMRSAIFRMKYSTANVEPISKYVKNQYKQTFLATWSTSSLFEEYYDIQVTEDELAGIALYIQAAIIRRKKDRPVKVLLVSDQGMASSQLYTEQLKYNIQEITEISTTSFHDLKIGQYKDVDVIINMSVEEIRDDRVVHVGEHLSESDIDCVRQKVNQVFYFRKRSEFHFSSLCHPLFEVDLFLIHPQIENKDQLITMMVKKLEEKGDVTSQYLQSVFEREKATTTSIGRGIAIPHGNMAEVNEPRIVVAILDKPISWHDDLVDVVFLLAVKMTTKFEIRRTKQFYKDFLKLTDSDENLEAIKKMRTSLDIYQYFIK